MTLEELLQDQPPVRRIESARSGIREKLLESGKRMVIIDDDPTGPQAVQDVPVYFDWSVSTLRKAFRNGEPVFFISTNSRSLNPGEMTEITLEASRNLREASAQEKAEILLASRSDSTLRGHFPAEVDALVSGTGITPDGIILVPAFFEGRRFTIGDIHYAEQDGDMTPAHLTEFARDPSFPYENSNLKKWVEEKTAGKVQAGEVISLSLKTIRQGGPDAVTAELMKASAGTIVISNAACYEDLEVLALGIFAAEEKGRAFLYRCSASFIKARGGFEDVPLLTREQLAPGEGPGLVIAGSYVEKTSRQLKHLIDSGLAEGIEFHVGNLTTEDRTDKEIKAVSDYVNKNLSRGITTVIYTSRDISNPSGTDFTETGKRIIRSLCRVVENISIKPGFVIAKGGITSIEIARTALKVKEARAAGQILGGVPVLRLPEETRWAGIPYVVFPGNVGDETALAQAVTTLKE